MEYHGKVISAGGASQVVVVLGMHRSGTSLCMNILALLGVRVSADMLPANEFNERGFFESREILRLNESILRRIGLAWHSIPPAGFHENWIRDPAIEDAKQQLISLIRDRASSGGGLWGFKDPRVCLLLPLYREIFRCCDLEPSYILCNRNPRAIARSLGRRNGFAPILSELLWMDHTARAIAGTGAQLKALIDYEAWFDNADRQLRLLTEAIGLPMSGGAETHHAIARELDHGHGASEPYALTGTEAIYELLRAGHYQAVSDEVAKIRQALSLGIRPAAALCQLYWRTAQADHFTEANSYLVYTDTLPVRRVAQLLVPSGIRGLTGLRLDPSESSGSAYLHSMRLFDTEGSLLWEWDGGADILGWQRSGIALTQTAGSHRILANFDGKDPYLICPLANSQLAQLSETGGVFAFEFSLLVKTEAVNMPERELERDEAVTACQLFWRTKDLNCFTETNSCQVLIHASAGAHLARLPIPSALRDVTGLRLDPADSAGVAHLFSLKLFDAQDELVWEWDGTPASLHKSHMANVKLLPHVDQAGVLAYFEDSDPVLNLPITEEALRQLSGTGGVFEVGFAWLAVDSAAGCTNRNCDSGLRARESAFATSDLHAMRRAIAGTPAIYGTVKT